MNKDAVYYLAINSSKGAWGRAENLQTAKKKAFIKRGNSYRVLKISGIPPCTAEDLNPNTNGGLILEGYKPGDQIKPFVNNYGGACYWGVMEEVESKS